MERIENIHPGRDSIVRVVDVRTKTGVYRRPAVSEDISTGRTKV